MILTWLLSNCNCKGKVKVHRFIILLKFIFVSSKNIHFYCFQLSMDTSIILTGNWVF